MCHSDPSSRITTRRSFQFTDCILTMDKSFVTDFVMFRGQETDSRDFVSNSLDESRDWDVEIWRIDSGVMGVGFSPHY